ncbi:hypothetical protein Molly5_197 [Maribacter phage Molly_5]|uniref:Uncharacterized protein n=1 Tax=Maribacter phage Molly_1 TaxID=2745685 RepID=A0A8E4UYA0_9CAUD|nr:hypothetical protein M1M29_gp197 [Maribacter phage Molly_1]QQO97696.1 hypothetical protein Molly2_197 [Maribacter phage Molly_2]QQO97896.1 hypothetical protein Molly3_197 [Maribacter phage Molly_3]QQO98096.1 hypothetical protein Molly4_197 [Maribacter phage Molly_4]QQO98296.1 hypothetical protein Molly5_197 [Maribacter phage Molly_5]QQO97496.1 hypothetical protein Molly1_197 [Maribacter phage Molly_1]
MEKVIKYKDQSISVIARYNKLIKSRPVIIIKDLNTGETWKKEFRSHGSTRYIFNKIEDLIKKLDRADWELMREREQIFTLQVRMYSRQQVRVGNAKEPERGVYRKRSYYHSDVHKRIETFRDYEDIL